MNEKLAQRLEAALKHKRGITTRKMFGGLCFLLHGNMLCGVEKNNLVMRVGADNYEKLLKLKYASPMDFTGKPMKGLLYVSSEGVKTKAALDKWVNRCLDCVSGLPKKQKNK